MKFIAHLPWQYFIDVAKVMPRFGKDINGDDQAGAIGFVLSMTDAGLLRPDSLAFVVHASSRAERKSCR
jgi:hypothetical protein